MWKGEGNGTPGICWVQAKDAAMHPTIQRKAPATKNVQGRGEKSLAYMLEESAYFCFNLQLLKIFKQNFCIKVLEIVLFTNWISKQRKIVSVSTQSQIIHYLLLFIFIVSNKCSVNIRTRKTCDLTDLSSLGSTQVLIISVSFVATHEPRKE